ncbi:alpha/beta fold hydrolase [Parafrankia sp. EUN1f]|uniref:alpha/beta fold hydrolase n=1 Tax=Parafrankia sp. EUN1f TaxID=102897 RepID=UPI0001C47076|nr:alpha/beta fold hydrolase [Parafrankia sp. EUN1f]EFC80332.1 AMP-dependent synthetase and ligase [Parafrankia sp. EUN1f]
MVGTQPLIVPATNPAWPYPTIMAQFSRIAAARAANPAVRDGDLVLSYAELDRRSSALASALATADDLDANLGILLGQGACAIIAMLGALKAGRPFVPLDPMLPPARLAQVLHLAGATTCVTDVHHRDLLVDAGPTRTVLLDARGAVAEPNAGPVAPGAAADGRLPWEHAGPEDPAFVVFSSGSTGVPKGVVWRHRTVLHEVASGISQVGVSPADQIALVLPTAFAAGITVMFWGLLRGATLHTLDPRARGVTALPAWIIDRGITTLHLTPALIRALTTATPPGCVLGQLRAVTSSGEAVYGRDVAALREILPTPCTFYNWSGSTETASLAFFPVRSGERIPAGPLPVGWAVDGKVIEIVDEQGNAVPDGVAGEVSVTSQYLSAGYWNGPEMTAQRFRPVRESAGSGTGGSLVTYRSGDLARRSPDGCIELLGRADAAVKIRGYLVEPAEIEAVLLASPDVVEAVVTAERPKDQPPRLIAYVVCTSTVKSATVAVRALLREKLPSYMVPSAVVLLRELPRNERGKVDRAALPPPPVRAPGRAPTGRSHWEHALRDLFAQTLKIDDIGVDDDFVELGGDSLLAQHLLSEIAARLGVTLPTSVLAEAPTIATLAVRVAAAHRGIPNHPTCVPLNAEGSGAPLFCVAGAGGLAINFVAFARSLGPDLRVYGLQAQGLERRALPDWSIERHARRHLAMLRVLQPTGPYHIAGFSFGGLVALEMAQLLSAAGEQVALLALLDSRLPPSARSVAGETGTGSGAGAGSHAGWQVTSLRRWASRPVLPSGSKVRKAARLPLTGIVRYPGLSHFDAFFDQARIVSRSYRVRPYPGRTVVYLAEDNADPAREGWTRHLTGDVTVVSVPGEHHSMLNEPHVAVLAADLRARIDEVRPS